MNKRWRGIQAWWVVLGVCIFLAAPADGADAETPLRERVAHGAVRLDEPESLYEIKSAIERCFGLRLRLSIEPLPEQCAGASTSDIFLDPFTIVEGERFGPVIRRLEAASAGRWIFEEIHGVPLLRPDAILEGHGTLLDTVIEVDIEARTMWEALCALARAVNHKNEVATSGRRPLMIMFFAVSVMEHPPEAFVEEREIVVSVSGAPARDALCAILAEVDINARYFYTCYAEGHGLGYDYVAVTAPGARGRPMTGDELEQLSKTKDWMSDERMLAVQVPGYDADDE